MQKTVFLIGPMASGKSYWAKQIANQTGLPFVDLDQTIEQAEETVISQIFSDAGEDHFRKLEKQHLRQLGALPPCIVATGGGTPCFSDNMNWMNAQGLTIYLQIPVDVQMARLRLDQQARPLLQGIAEQDLEAFLAELTREREPWYLEAQHTQAFTSDDARYLDELLAVIGY